MDDCHFCTDPVCPDKVRFAVFDPEQTVADDETLPPTVAGFTVTLAIDEMAELQTPLVTTALYKVVVERFVKVRDAVVFEMFVQEAPPFVDDSQRVIVPT
jgi:hypothetical protein